MTLKDAHILISGTCEHVILYGKWDFADVIKDLEMRTQCYHKNSYSREAGGSDSGKGDGMLQEKGR